MEALVYLMTASINSQGSEHHEMAERRILRIVKNDGSTLDLNIVRAQKLPGDSPGAIRVELVSGDDFSLSFNEDIIGPFIDIESIKVVRESDGE